MVIGVADTVRKRDTASKVVEIKNYQNRGGQSVATGVTWVVDANTVTSSQQNWPLASRHDCL